MEKLNIIVMVFLIELFADLILVRVYHIKTRFWFVLFLQVPKICACVLSVFYSSILWLVFLVNFLSKVLCVFFLNDTLEFKRFICILFSEYVVLFSIMGFSEFLLLWFKAGYSIIFKQNFPVSRDFIAFLGIILYVFAFFCLTKSLPKNKNFGRYFVEVSLMRNGRHINVYGLIDSGNSVVDPVTNKPVILLSKKSFSRLFSKKELDEMKNNECRKVECETISGEKIKIPIFENISVKLKFEKEFIETNCVVGVTDARFENGRYDCLLNRDYV